jgi:hypothetical protein
MWYYSIDGKQQGPFEESALDHLIADRVITAETFVWKEGLPDWVPLGQIRGFEKTVTAEDIKASTCDLCGKQVGADNLIELVGLRVCAACKPTAVQTLREGAPLSSTHAQIAWCDGKKVVTNDKKVLPTRCYKCNQPAATPALKRKLYWHPAAYYLLIFVHVFIYLVVAIFVRKKATVDVYLCTRHLQRRKYFIIGGWSGAALAIVLFVWGAVENTTPLAVAGIVLLLASMIIGLVGASLTRAARIKDGTVWMRGAGKEFLASLPPWT